MNDLALTLPQITDRIRHVMHNNIIEIGNLLMQAKSMLPHGEFQDWAERDLNIKPRSAQNYMRAAQFVQDKYETVAHLPPAILYKLAAPNAPAEIVQKVVSGETRDPDEITKAVERHHALRRRQKRQQSCTDANAADKLAKRKAEFEAKAEETRRHAAEQVRPLVQRIAAAGLTSDLSAALNDYDLKLALTEALREVVR